ncbi:putative F-box domain, leucine-rich repeat domain, L domain-containing protein [Medicago truncatula]|uniref:Putative F-box domain, leucine-rich repeat domain, L domain-containing protein n=1 Tax=Medicago truncatula TaxID=3880 RepID=A0A396JQA2_MEDTR|nr:putative F-box domain, leucine-rich repeat domain, L domain-containing protein [Medicago truncatula]
MACSYVEYDRLSNLSDDLIYCILSFLSTKESYRTCVLSTRWRSIYTKIPDLHFEFPEESDLVSSKEIKYVYAALLRRTENLRKLSLYSRDHDIDSWQPQDIHMWVSKALDLKVKELDLGLELHEKTLLPCRLFTYESLVVLKLRGRIQPKLDSSFDVYLPSLKILHLQSTMFNCIFDDHIEYSLTNFLSGCPNLEELFLEESFTQLINVSLNSLKRLYICLFMPISHPDLSIYPLQINAPSLEVLTIMDFSLSPRKYEFTNLSNLDRAALCICKHSDFNSSYTILKEFSNVKSLTLGHKTFHFLSMEDKLDNTHLLTFHNLLFLSIEISKNCNWNMLVSFLHNAPKLKDLSIKVRMKSFYFLLYLHTFLLER